MMIDIDLEELNAQINWDRYKRENPNIRVLKSRNKREGHYVGKRRHAYTGKRYYLRGGKLKYRSLDGSWINFVENLGCERANFTSLGIQLYNFDGTPK